MAQPRGSVSLERLDDHFDGITRHDWVVAFDERFGGTRCPEPKDDVAHAAKIAAKITKEINVATVTLGCHTHLHIDPSGELTIGNDDAGLTGGKIIIGGWCSHGSGASSSGENPTKALLDHSAAKLCQKVGTSVPKPLNQSPKTPQIASPRTPP